MTLVAVLLSVGAGLFGAGLFYRLFDDIINDTLQQYVLSNAYYLLSDLVWDMIPYILMIMGVICLVLGAIVYKGHKAVVYE